MKLRTLLTPVGDWSVACRSDASTGGSALASAVGGDGSGDGSPAAFWARAGDPNSNTLTTTAPRVGSSFNIYGSPELQLADAVAIQQEPCRDDAQQHAVDNENGGRRGDRGQPSRDEAAKRNSPREARLEKPHTRPRNSVWPNSWTSEGTRRKDNQNAEPGRNRSASVRGRPA